MQGSYEGWRMASEYEIKSFPLGLQKRFSKEGWIAWSLEIQTSERLRSIKVRERIYREQLYREVRV